MANTITPKFRASYAHVFTPQLVTNDDGTAKIDPKTGQQAKEYSVMAIFPPGADLSALKAEAKRVATEKWGANIPKNLQLPFRTEKRDGSVPDGVEEGGCFMNLRTKMKPGLVDASNQDIIDPVEFYSGCFARASVRAYAYDQKGNKGVSFGLQNMQKLADGEPLGGQRIKPQNEFEAVAGAVEGADANALFD